MTQRGLLPGPEPGHEAFATSTGPRIPNMLQQDDQCEAGICTHVDGTNPFRLLLGGDCSPFSPYRWLCTGVLFVRIMHGWCRP